MTNNYINQNNNQVKQNSLFGKLIKNIVFIFLFAILFFSSTFIVKEGEYVSVRRFSKISSIKNNAGLYFKTPILDSTQSLTKRKMVYDLKPSDVLTSDKKALVVDTYLIWSIEDPLKFIKTVSYVTEMEKRLDAATYNAIKNNVSKITQGDIINPIAYDSDLSQGRVKLNNDILISVNEQIKDYGAKLDFIEIKKLDLPIDNEQAVFNRMISERQQIATSFVADGDFEASKIKNETDKNVEIILSAAKSKAESIRGEADSEYMKILSETYNNPNKAEFYKFMRSLEALENSMKGEKTLILTDDSPLVKVFTQSQ